MAEPLASMMMVPRRLFGQSSQVAVNRHDLERSVRIVRGWRVSGDQRNEVVSPGRGAVSTRSAMM
jgi:hypothetical protein